MMASCPPAAADSPDGRLGVTLRFGEGGRPEFGAAERGRMIVDGTLGLEFADNGPLREGLRVGGFAARVSGPAQWAAVCLTRLILKTHVRHVSRRS